MPNGDEQDDIKTNIGPKSTLQMLGTALSMPEGPGRALAGILGLPVPAPMQQAPLLAQQPAQLQTSVPMRAPLLGRIGHIAAQIGKGALLAASPQSAPLVPGTEQYRERQAGLAQKEQLAQSEIGLREAEAVKALRPEDPGRPVLTETGAWLQNPETRQWEHKIGDGKGQKPEDVVKAYSDALARGDVEQIKLLRPRVKDFIETTEKQHPSTGEDAPMGSEAVKRANAVLEGLKKYGVNVPPLPDTATHRDLADIKPLLENQATLAAAGGRAQESTDIRREMLGLEKARLEETKQRDVEMAPIHQQAAEFARTNMYRKITDDWRKSNDNLQAVHDALSDPKAIKGPADWGLLMSHLQQFRAGGMRINNVEIQGLQNATNLMDRARQLGQSATVGAVLGPELRQSLIKITSDVLERSRKDRLSDLKRAGFKEEEIGDELKSEVGGGAATSGAPAVGTVVGGYRFKGGNHRDKASWEKVSP